MADEITVSLSVSASKTGSGSFASPRISFQADMADSNLVGGVTQDIGFAASELVTFGEIAAIPALVVIQNLDTTNYIEVGGDSGLTVFKMKVVAGEALAFRPTSTTLYCKANVAAVRIQKWVA